MLCHLQIQLFRSHTRSVATKVGIPEVLKKSPPPRSKVSEYLDFDGKFPLRKGKGSIWEKKSVSKPVRKAKKLKKEGKKKLISAVHNSNLDQTKADPKKSPLRVPAQPLDFITKCEQAVRPNDEELQQVRKPRGESISKLAHKLDRVLFSPGVHFLQDPRTRVYNFSPYLKSIVSHDDFHFEKVHKFVSASKDATLLREAKVQNKKFYSSTSSMTLTLHQFYLFLNNYSPKLESKYRFAFPDFSRTARDLPLAVFVEPKGANEANGETMYSVTSDKSTDIEILLSVMGHCLEALLTTGEEEFKEFLIKRGDDTEPGSADESKPKSETAETVENVYNYLGYGDFLMRSQLDCYDSRLPGNGTFDLKTRAVASIRYDKSKEASDSTYQIWKLHGNVESFQREYDDLIRTGGLLKYGFQARIGQMDGIFIAYHNINSFFGFQYLPLNEIDKVFYSNTDFAQGVESFCSAQEVEQHDDMATAFAESQFKASLNIWQNVMRVVEQDFKGTKYEGWSFRLVINRVNKLKHKAQHSKPNSVRHTIGAPWRESVLSVFAVPISRAEANEFQLVSSKYQTSFREDISDEERLQNLEKIQMELNDLNQELLSKHQLFSYVVNASLFVDGKRVSGKKNHPYPKKVSANIEWRYHIQRICKKHEGTGKTPDVRESPKVLVEQYLRATQLCTNMLTKAYREWPEKKEPSLTDTLRKYSEVGKIRLEKWKEFENPPKVY